jgi:hypothetical protein
MSQFDRIPHVMKQLDQWVCIHADSKVPMQSLVDEAASSTNPKRGQPSLPPKKR